MSGYPSSSRGYSPAAMSGYPSSSKGFSQSATQSANSSSKGTKSAAARVIVELLYWSLSAVEEFYTYQKAPIRASPPRPPAKFAKPRRPQGNSAEERQGAAAAAAAPAPYLPLALVLLCGVFWLIRKTLRPLCFLKVIYLEPWIIFVLTIIS